MRGYNLESISWKIVLTHARFYEGRQKLGIPFFVSLCVACMPWGNDRRKFYSVREFNVRQLVAFDLMQRFSTC